MKNLVRFLSILTPNLVVGYAYKRLTSPQVKKLRENELEVLDKATKKRITYEGFDIQLYQWGNGSKKVLLIHGWEGQAGNFSDLITELIKQDFTIYSFDGPSHGFSSKGKTSVFEFVGLVKELILKYQVSKLVSHSFGGVATTYALSQLPEHVIDHYVLLTTPNKFSERIEEVSKQSGITEKVKRKLVSRVESEIELDINTLNVEDFVQKVNVHSALIIHDKNDKVIPLQQSQAVAAKWEACTLEEIEGTGHFRILRTPEVIERAIAFLQ